MKTANRNSRLVGIDALDSFDALIDVRTPAEFADDHLPGAINAPVLSNDERKLVGTIYKQESAFKATRLGAALVARNIATHLETVFADQPKNWKPLIYCWRGGKRSGSMVEWFNLIGWRARQLDGGYKHWRNHVITELKQLPGQLHFVVLTGPTGSGKTHLLKSLAKVGAQVLDLEGLARHRGSLLGAEPGLPQPSQRALETQLYQRLASFDPARPVFVEAESRRIGRLDLPSELMAALHQGSCVRLEVTPDRRLAFLLQDYQHLFAAPDHFKQMLERLLGLHSRATIDAWQTWVDEDRRAELFSSLMLEHYDPAYRRSSQSNFVKLPEAFAFTYDPSQADTRGEARQLLEQFES